MFEIILPKPKYLRSAAHRRMASHARCLWSLNSRKDVTVSDGNVLCPPRLRHKGIYDGNGKYGNFFSVNGNLFMLLDTDKPHVHVKHWLNYYKSSVKAFFLCCYFKDLKEHFDNSNVKVFPCFGAANINAPFLDIDEKTKQLPDRSILKDIPIFFRGKFRNNIQRFTVSKMVKKHFPGSHIENCLKPNNFISEETYLNLLQRSKIVWAPPSAGSINPSDYAFYLREREAMCTESLFVRQPIDVFTPAELVIGEHFVEIKRDNSNLIEILEKYLSNEEERLRIAKNGRLFFEQHCTELARATYLLDKCISVISGADNDK